VTPTTVVVATHSWSPGWATAIDEYLRPRTLRYLWISHPLFAGQGSSEFRLLEKGNLVDSGALPAAAGTARYVLDLRRTIAWCSRNGRFELFVAGDNLLAMAGLWLRRRERVGAVAMYSIDFVPERFANPLLNRFYHAIDRAAVHRSDVVWNTAEGVIEGREARDGGPSTTPQLVVPIGADVERIASVRVERDESTFVYLGHLLEKQGVQVVIEAMPAVLAQLPRARFVVIGDGPYMQELVDLAERRGVSASIEFTGFMDDHRRIEKILLGCAVGVAPYVPDQSNYSRFQDLPGKIVTYLACGLPVITTTVPRHAEMLASSGAGRVVDYTPQAVASALLGYLSDRAAIESARTAAIEMGLRYDWRRIFDNAFQRTAELMTFQGGRHRR
jgi:glycosyltransferase involved in cell wall biosynthesis